MSHDNLEQTIELYLKTVRDLRASRVIRDANMAIVEERDQLEEL